MTASFDPGTLLGTSYPLSGGVRVRLRMARSSDSPSIRRLLERQGLDPGELWSAKLVQFDPRRRCVLCAAALIDGSEALLGVGAIELDGDRAATPDTLIVDSDRGDELRGLLSAALVGRSGISRVSAA